MKFIFIICLLSQMCNAFAQKVEYAGRPGHTDMGSFISVSVDKGPIELPLPTTRNGYEEVIDKETITTILSASFYNLAQSDCIRSLIVDRPRSKAFLAQGNYIESLLIKVEEDNGKKFIDIIPKWKTSMSSVNPRALCELK